MASITKRGSYWRAQVRRKGYPPHFRIFDTKAQAETWVRQIESEMSTTGLFLHWHRSCLFRLDIVASVVENLVRGSATDVLRSGTSRLNRSLGKWAF